MVGKGLQRVAASLAAAVVLVVGFDYATYAATGQSLLLGRANVADNVTTVANTSTHASTGAALRLLTKNSAFAPFTTNAQGLVANLYSTRAANADQLGGMNPSQLGTSIDGFDFIRTNVPLGSVAASDVGRYDFAYASGQIQRPGPYAVGGSLTFGCDAKNNPSQYDVMVFASPAIATSKAIYRAYIPASQCGTPITVPPHVLYLENTDRLFVVVTDFEALMPYPPLDYAGPVTFRLIGSPTMTHY